MTELGKGGSMFKLLLKKIGLKKAGSTCGGT